MATLNPFRGLRYSAVAEMVDLVAPPYDVISPQQRSDLAARHADNIVEVILPDGVDDGRYDKAGVRWRQWLDSGVVEMDASPSLYLLQETFKTPSGEELTRIGVIGEIDLEDPSSGSVKRHERTFAGPKADRLKLTRSCQANLSPLLGLYSDGDRLIETAAENHTSHTPDVDVLTDGVRRRLWVVDDPVFAQTARSVLEQRVLVIADGHHRYETALEYRDQCRLDSVGEGRQPHDSVMFCCVNILDSGVVAQPYHRLVSGPVELSQLNDRLPECFSVDQIGFDLPTSLVICRLEEAGMDRSALALYDRDGGWRILTLVDQKASDALVGGTLSSQWRHLDVTLLHYVVLGDMLGIDPVDIQEDMSIEYTTDIKTAKESVDNFRADMLCAMNPTPPQQVVQIALENESMPHKSTYFSPKLLTGLVMRDLSPSQM
ncbi:MAG: DUF1015 domain-containing protein [Candidatus Latescibacteria bacterium]|nr:DUF1015 domain-containing protein [Candidatus Latescibacterota bacterium]